MQGRFTLIVCTPGDATTRRYLADRRGIPWEEVCDLLKNVGEDYVIVLVYNEKGRLVLRSHPMGMSGPQIAGLEDVAQRIGEH